MPLIHIRALPGQIEQNIPAAIGAISYDISQATSINHEHISITWTTIKPDHYAVAGVTASSQPDNSHPLLAELLLPEFHADEEVARIVAAVAASIATHTPIQLTNIFIHAQRAYSGQVFDNGELVSF